MDVVSSERRRPGTVDSQLAAVLASVCPDELRRAVTRLSVPRPWGSRANRDVRDWLGAELADSGYQVERQGRFDNLVATWRNRPAPAVLVGAHYDSIARTPGADDNASAVAALLSCARILSRAAPTAPIAFALFNREEDGMLGSTDLVDGFLPSSGWRLRETHVLEMVGFCARGEGTQRFPRGVPVKPRTTGDFLALIANRDSNRIVAPIVDSSRTYLPELPIIGLRVHLGLERHLPVLLRSDHAPFWRRRIPTLMWTDTAELRNPNYHQPSDVPETLDYEFLARVTRALVLRCLDARPAGPGASLATGEG